VRNRFLEFFSAFSSALSAPWRSHFVLAIALCGCPIASATVYHVNPVGDDTAGGDTDHPFQTISRAAFVAEAGDTVLIAPGIYREAVELTESGTPGRPIAFQAEKPGTAIITGAEQLAVWVPVSDHPGQYISDWPYDFIIDHNADGSPVRDHGAPPPVGCAEQVYWESHPLRQVMTSDDLSPGSFWVDWQFHTMTVWLPGSIDARAAHIEGCARSYLVTPKERDNVFSDARYITLRGLVFRDAANFAQRGGVILGTGWRAEHCIVEGNNAGGMSLNGDNIVVDHCIAQYNGFCGISGSGDNNTLQDCVVRGNNRKGFPPGWDGGGGKFTNTHHLRVIRHTSYENTGPGLWLDIDNTDYSITDSIFYGNHGLDEDWQGSGICLEISPGPGVVANNNIYSNTGAGILLAESEHISVQGNTFVDNTKGVELRAMNGRDNHQLRFVNIIENRFKEWRKEAIVTSLGDWTAASAAERNITINQNVYDPPKNQPFISWGDSVLAGLPEVRAALGMEEEGSIESILFPHPLENVKTVTDTDRPTIARAIANASVGQTVMLPVNSRSELLDDNGCAVFDEDNSCIAVALPTPELRQAMQESVTIAPMAMPVMLAVRIDRLDPHMDVRGTLVEVK